MAIDQVAVEHLKATLLILSTVLNALPTTSGVQQNWLVWSAIHINRVAHGFATLREMRQLHASKLFVRPLLEAAFNMAAVMKEKAFIYRIALYEREQDRKFLQKRFPEEWKRSVEEFEKFERELRNAEPNLSFEKAPASAYDAADRAGIPDAYQLHYRIYSRFIHGSLRAMSGTLDEMTDGRDTWTCLLVVLMTLNFLKHEKIGEIPDLTVHWQWLDDNSLAPRP